jgi:hypothetical protein
MTTVYIADDGDDKNDGLTPENAVHSIKSRYQNCNSGWRDGIGYPNAPPFKGSKREMSKKKKKD